MKPNKGWHKMYCSDCGADIGKMVHFGGDKELKDCEYCKCATNICFECFEKEMEKMKASDLFC